MANMEVHYKNYFNTTTLCDPNTGTDTVANLIDRNKTTQYSSSGKNDDTAGVTIAVEFLSSRNINRICLQNINLKGFKIYYSSNSANTIDNLTSTCETSTSQWSENSSTSMYLIFPTTAMTSVFIVATTTMIANQEKKIGQIWCDQTYLKFENNPSYKNYKVTPGDAKEHTHEMVGGGWTNYRLGKYFKADIKMQYQSASMTSDFNDLHDEKSSFVFVPYPTGSSWFNYDYEGIFECNWIGNFDFAPSQDNFVQTGYNGKIKLRETPR
ncbi:hypothetical protein [Pseudoalteromonas sp.]|uniref:hypothetical protein n=1 Tax=Pseudoalteromonas sp. TaxID=53249 RepID=UPI002635763D|nr:hypothetical protein [Pseudoalteromonas sp.]MCP4586762.1 hypothetical protein [Pseudoalteromonas sp.]